MSRRKRNKYLAVVFMFLFILFIVVSSLFPDRALRVEIRSEYAAGDPEFIRCMSALLGPPLVEGNEVTTLLNGAETFPSMLEAIRSAKKTITFESYIYWSGVVGKEFTDALSERSSAG